MYKNNGKDKKQRLVMYSNIYLEIKINYNKYNRGALLSVLTSL